MHSSRKNYTVEEEHHTLPRAQVTQIKRIFLINLESDFFNANFYEFRSHFYRSGENIVNSREENRQRQMEK